MGGKHVVESPLSTVSSFLMVTPRSRTWHIGTYRAVGGLQGKLITQGCEVFDFEATPTRSLGALRAPTSSWRPFGHSDRVTHASVIG